MKTYYRALPKTDVAPTTSRHVADFQDAFDGVSDIDEASKDFLDSVKVTQRKLKEQHSLETTLVAVKDEMLMTPKYVICLER